MGRTYSCTLSGCKLGFSAAKVVFFALSVLSLAMFGCVLPCQEEQNPSVSFLHDAELMVCVCVQLASSSFLLSYAFNLTGKPFIHPDGSAVVYNPAAVAPAAGRNPQQGKAPQQPIPAPAQQQPANHLHSQVSGRDHIAQQ